MKKKSENSGSDIVWEPETLKDYMDIVQADLQYDEVYDLFPKLYNVHVYARRALDTGVNLIKLFRKTEKEISKNLSGDFETDEEGFIFWSVKHKWIIDICRLWIYISEIIAALDNPPCDEYWPKRPGINGLGEVGRAALEVIELFAISVGDIAYYALKSVCEREKYQELVYDFIESEILVLEPTIESRALKWRSKMKEGLEDAYPLSQWSDVLLDRDRRRIAIVLACEEDEALKAQKDAQDAQKDATSVKGEEDFKKSNTSHVDLLIKIFEDRDAFMSSSDLASVFDVDAEVLRKRLDRHREKDPLNVEFYIESQDRGMRKAKYLYNFRYVVNVIEQLEKRRLSDKRPPEKKSH